MQIVELVAAQGIEPETNKNQQVTRSGQRGTNPGQKEEKVGQNQKVIVNNEVGKNTQSVELRTEAYVGNTPIRTVPDPNLNLTELAPHLRLREVINAWPGLSEEIRKAILALVNLKKTIIYPPKICQPYLLK